MDFPMQSFLKSSSGWQAGNILDLRPPEEFALGHLLGATSHPHNPDKDSPISSIFLPPRHEPLLVVAGESQPGPRLAEELESRGRVPVEFLVWRQEDCPAELLATGSSAAHLWSAPPWLVQHESWLPPPAAGPVLDLACGSGRALVWLAERGYRTVGVDWQPEALALGRQLAESRAVSCDFRPGDLRDPAQVPQGPWSVILNFRFLQKDLLARIPAMLQPGGVALVRTFRQVAGYQGHPQRRHRLAAGELLQAFPAANCEIIAHEESHDPDGRPAAGIVARSNPVI